MSPVRAFSNTLLRPLGVCVGRIVRVQERRDGQLVDLQPPSGWRAYRVLPLRNT